MRDTAQENLGMIGKRNGGRSSGRGYRVGIGGVIDQIDFINAGVEVVNHADTPGPDRVLATGPTALSERSELRRKGLISAQRKDQPGAES